MSRPAPRLALWLAGVFAHLDVAEDVRGEIEERWLADGHRPRLIATCRAMTLAGAVAWHALKDRGGVDDDRRRGGFMSSGFLREWAFAIRHWKSRPGLALSAILILSIGIGATTAIYSIVDAVILRDLPWYQSDRLVNLYVVRPHWRSSPTLSQAWDTGNHTWVIFKDLQSKAPTLEALGAWRTDRPTLNGEPGEPVRVHSVSASLLPMLGVAPQQGRFFVADEDDVPSDVAIVSHETWQRRYGGRADILEYPISLNERRYRIVGVLPPAFRWGTVQAPEFLLPLGNTPVQQRTEGNHFLSLVARLSPDVTLSQVTTDITPWVRGTESPNEKAARVISLAEDQTSSAKRPLYTLLAGAALLLLIATTNVAALMQGAAGARRQELAVRVALGGGRGQVARQLLMESVVLAAAAVILGVLFAAWLTPTLVGLSPTTFFGADAVAVDLRVLSFAVVLTLAITLLFGTGPALAMSKANPADALRPGRGTTRSHRGARWIVATQVGLCLVLIVGAGLLSETVRRLSSQPLGFDAAPLAVANVRLPPIAGLTPEQRSSRTQAVVDRLARLPGVVSAAATSSAPFGSGSGTSGFQIPGKNFERAPNANRHIVTEEYFETLGIRAIKGRVFDATDRRGEYGAVVTDVFERTLMDGDAVGRTFVLNGNDHTVLGVIEAPKHRRYSDDPPIAFYLLSRQLPEWGVGNYLVRAAREPEALLPSIRQAVSEVEPQVSFIAVETMETMMSRSIGEERYRSQLALAFAAAALLLAGIGLYGVIARTVNDQRKEIGVRLALGASPRAVRQEVIGGALIVTALGLVPGVPAAIAASHGIATLLYGIAPISPPVLIAATVVVAAAAIVAALGPALRAARIDPIEALRN